MTVAGGTHVLELFKRSLESSAVVRKGDYHYFVNPLTDGVPRIDPRVMEEVLGCIKQVGDFRCDLLLAPEAMGIAIAAPLSLQLGIPYSVVRKRRYGLPGEVPLTQVTAYSQGDMYINGVGEGDRVVLVDDVISTGGTLRAIILALKGAGAELVDVIVAVEKGPGRAGLERELGVRIKTLVKVEVQDGRLKVLS